MSGSPVEPISRSVSSAQKVRQIDDSDDSQGSVGAKWKADGSSDWLVAGRKAHPSSRAFRELGEFSQVQKISFPGVFPSALTEDDATGLYTVREGLEGLIARLVAEGKGEEGLLRCTTSRTR